MDLEFLVQTLQLVHANKHPECLDQNTALALRKLASNGVLDWVMPLPVIMPGQDALPNGSMAVITCLQRPATMCASSPAIRLINGPGARLNSLASK